MKAFLRRHWALIALACAHVLLKAACWPKISGAPLRGDQNAYRDGALALRNLVVDLVTLQGPHGPELQANVIGNGWLMPGQSILMTPLFLVAPDAGTTALHVYMGVVTTALLLLVAVTSSRVLGRRFGLAVLVVPGLLPMWVLFSYTAWGDTTGGLLVVLLLLQLVRLGRRLAAGERWTWRSAVGLGALTACCLYVRPSLLPLVAGCLLLATLGVLVAARGRERWHGVGMAAVAVATLVSLVLPWSISASQALDDRVVTTTTLHQSLAITFGDQDELCFGQCGPGTIWFSSSRYAREVGLLTGESRVEVMERMSDHALQGLTASAYADRVGVNARRFALQPTKYFTWVWWPESTRDGFAADLARAVTWGLYVLGGIALVGAAVGVRRRSFDDQVVSLLVTLFAMAIFAQPMLHVSTGRYWPVFAPLMGLSLALVSTAFVRRHRRHDGRGLLTVAQAVAVAVLGLVVGALVVLAA